MTRTTLGTDPNEFCGLAFAEAMRPIAGKNVDLEQVRANLNALGQAIHTIATVHAEPYSEKPLDDAFWTWIEQLQACVADLATWQAGVAAAVAAWAPTTAPEQALRSALQSVPAPKPAPKAAPTVLKGAIR